MGACASSQQEHPELHGHEVSKDDGALKCKVRRNIVIELQREVIYSCSGPLPFRSHTVEIEGTLPACTVRSPVGAVTRPCRAPVGLILARKGFCLLMPERLWLTVRVSPHHIVFPCRCQHCR